MTPIFAFIKPIVLRIGITVTPLFLLSACQSNSTDKLSCSGRTPPNPSAYSAFSPLAGLALPHPGQAMHAGSWDRTASGDHDCIQDIPPGQTITLMDYQGAGIIHRFWMTITGTETNATLRQTILRMYWDDETEPSVECPLGDFFGVGFGRQKDYISLPLNETSGGYNCYWPMPFHKRARWTLENRTSKPIGGFFYNIDYTVNDSLPDDMKEFHACWRRENPTDPHHNYTILEAEGDGTYVGTALFMQGKNTMSFLEGNEMIYIDQPNSNPVTPKGWKHSEAVPQIDGTGTEDYFCSGWYFDHGPYSAPYHGCVIKEDKNSLVSAYRWHIEDAIPFHKNIRVTIEHGSRDDLEVDYSSVAYFYQSGAHRPYPPMPQNPADLLPGPR